MGRSRDVKSDNLRIGIRFTENLARELHQAVSAKDRGNFESARAAWENAQQMLDTFITETGIEEYINAESAKVAAESKPASSTAKPKKKTRKPKAGDSAVAGEDPGAGDVPGSGGSARKPSGE